MKRLLTPFWLVCLFYTSALAQHKITFILQLPRYDLPQDAQYYLAAEHNNWNPGDANARFIKVKGQYQLVYEHPNTTPVLFKITRGSWNTVECREGGPDIPNRVLQVSRDTTVYIFVQDWKDLADPDASKHTLSPNVQVISEQFPMKALNSTRKVWIYLPPSYTSSRKRYPVVYMHDGQNLFDRLTTAFGTEWRVDESMDSLFQVAGLEYIVVGIDASAERRLQEYLPYNNPEYGPPMGKAYMSFIVNELMPYINKNYRTKRGAANTVIAGSSMGCLISLYGLLEYPKTFGAAGLFSGAYWIAPEVETEVARLTPKLKARVFLYAGDNESKSLMPQTQRIAATLRANRKNSVREMYQPGGRHEEVFWQQPFREFMLWQGKQ